ncbi:hypothetical protein ACFL3T_04215 [Patescibacteria group bacterium]
MEGWKEMTLPLDDNYSLLKRVFMVTGIIVIFVICGICCKDSALENPFEVGSPLLYLGLIVGMLLAMVIVFEIAYRRKQ